MLGEISVEPVRTIRMDTGLLPVEDQFAAWARHTPNTRVAPAKPGPFLARGAFWDLGSAAVTESLLDGFVAERDDILIQATAADHYLLVTLFAGETRFAAPGIDHLCGPGDAFICDFRRASVLTTPGVHCATVAMPRAFVEGAIQGVRLHGPLPLGPATDLLVRTIGLLVQGLPTIPRTSTPFYARVIRDLLAAATAQMPPQRVAVASSRRATVLAYVEAQPPGTLAVLLLLDALGMTRSTLYRLFKEDGGVMAYDSRRRLRQLHGALADPLVLSGIAELGARHGFLDRTHLARLFRANYGSTMTVVRRNMHSLAQKPDSEELPDRLRATIRRMASD